MPATRFVDQLNVQIGNELAAHNQYLACAIYYDALTMPRMAAFFYDQALEERGHAMMMVAVPRSTPTRGRDPGVDAPTSTFADVVAPVSSRSTGRRVTDQSTACCGSRARRTTSPPSSSCSGSSRSRSRRSPP